MPQILSDAALDQLFREGRSHNYFLDRAVTDDQLRALWDLTRMGPTSMNQLPLRVVWCKSPEARDRLAAHASPGNVDKVKHAPVCAILAMDVDYHLRLPEFAPHMDDPVARFADKHEMRETSAFRNSSLQGGYFILAARALGLDCGPMSGFSNAGVDADFFADRPSWKSNFICSVGYGDHSRLHPRAPRPEFDRFTQIL